MGSTNVSNCEPKLGKRFSECVMEIDDVSGRKKNKQDAILFSDNTSPQIDAFISAKTTAGPGLKASRSQ